MALDKELCKSLATPCFVFDEEEFERSVLGFGNALKEKFDNCVIGYSVKTNSLPYILAKAKDLGCYAEVVSRDEYELARLVGYPINRIIYNGPMKSKDTFLEAVIGGAIVNIETKRELDWIEELPNDNRFSVGLRVNVNITKVSPGDADGEDDNSRFGFSIETKDFEDAVEKLCRYDNVRLSGLHLHRTSHHRRPEFYAKTIEYACDIIEKYKLKLDYIDVGGGYFGVFPNKPTYRDYAQMIYSALAAHGLEKLTVIVEPGNGLIASAIACVAEIIDRKRVADRLSFLTVDVSRNDVDPFFRKNDYLKEIVLSGGVDERGVFYGDQIIGGCSCLEYDRLFTLIDSLELNVGDRIIFNNVGAYTMTLSPLFIRLFPKVYSLRSGELRVVRQEWRAEDLLRNSIIPN